MPTPQLHTMRPFIPSLQSLIAFESAARHLSFTKAARELDITQTAISHQVKTLEDRLDTKLFVRQRNMLTLTPAAVEYLRSVNEAISMLAIASENTRKKKANTVLTIACLPTYAVKCLIPKLPDFQRKHPDIALHLSTSSNFDDFESNNYDVAIRYGAGRWGGMRADLIQGEEFFPVCSPRLLEEIGSHGSIEDKLARFVRIRTYFYSLYQDDWPAWLDAAGYSEVNFAGEAVFQLQLTSLTAAIEGSGLAIGRTPLVDRDLVQGTLVQPFGPRVSSGSSYYITSTMAKAKVGKVELFREWALTQLTHVDTQPIPHKLTAVNDS
ncbi:MULTISPECIES: LysR substrate-binding domain-containing protein [Burkholderia cepacia complex]|uniref:LysR substrate-binding domain-containing protein n=1 Tax=Burkholderia cepacia complex TaxID=87882 RepID=UPI001E3A969B|nr:MULTISPECIES: LysR substrate-binding domain-containing protein [Burkholderia cepacia complex]